MVLTLKSLAGKIENIEKELKNIFSRIPPPEKQSRFFDNGDGTITDKDANLIWQKQDNGKRMKWEEAKKYCNSNEAKLPGDGWRLPTVKELISLIDYERHSPAIDPLFLNTQSSYYWSSSPYAVGSGGAWDVNFGNGYVYWVDRSLGSCVRPVRQNS